MDDQRWYALRAFRNKTQPLMRDAQEACHRVYYANCLSTIFFIHCSLEWLTEFKKSHLSDFMIYGDASGKPAPIRDREMESFIMVTSVSYDQDIEVLEPKPQYAVGEQVRVTDGIYKGATGIVKRIKKDRKLLVAINGVAVVAISHIPMQYLEKV
jgi:Transcription antiterminator